MQGLLDFIKTPEGQGLLSGVFGYAANARRGTPINNLGRGGIAGLLGYSNAMEREQDAKQNEWLQQYRGLQMDQMRSEIEKNRQAEAERQRIDGLVRGAIGGFTPQQAIGMDASGPTQAKANMIGQPGQVDYRALYAQGVPMDKIQELVNLGNINKTKVKNIETINIDGKPVKVGIDEYGQQVAQIGMEWKPLERVDAGGYVGLYDPTDPTGGVRKLVDKTMSPEGRDASARGWATVNQGERRLQFEQGQSVADAGGPNQAGLVKQFGKPPKDYRWRADGTAEPIPGGPADPTADPKSKQRQDFAKLSANNVLSAVKDATGMIGRTTAGFGGSTLANVPGTGARDLQAKLETIKANLGFDRLQQMRDMSPTGGALGAIAVQELIALQSTVASLDQAQSPAQLQANLKKVERHYNNWLKTMNGEAPEMEERPRPILNPRTGSTLPPDIQNLLNKY